MLAGLAFVEFSLKLLVEGVDALLAAAPRRRLTVTERLERAREEFGERWLTRNDYMKLFAGISGPTASRELAEASGSRSILRKGELNRAKYRFA